MVKLPKNLPVGTLFWVNYSYSEDEQHCALWEVVASDAVRLQICTQGGWDKNDEASIDEWVPGARFEVLSEDEADRIRMIIALVPHAAQIEAQNRLTPW